MDLLLTLLLAAPPILFAITVHEVSHGWVAFKRGDPTAYLMGRLTLNPLKHLDLFGSFIFPGLLILMRAPFVFGWAKPVPVNFMALKDPKRDMIWVSLAGPASNLALGLASGLLFRLLYPGYQGPGTLLYPVMMVLFYLVLANSVLTVFNLLPIPPLDGSKVVAGLLPGQLSLRYLSLEKYGMFIFIGLIIFMQVTRINILNYLLLPASWLARALAGPGLFGFI